jgi:hypothetical protein
MLRASSASGQGRRGQVAGAGALQAVPEHEGRAGGVLGVVGVEHEGGRRQRDVDRGPALDERPENHRRRTRQLQQPQPLGHRAPQRARGKHPRRQRLPRRRALERTAPGGAERLPQHRPQLGEGAPRGRKEHPRDAVGRIGHLREAPRRWRGALPRAVRLGVAARPRPRGSAAGRHRGWPWRRGPRGTTGRAGSVVARWRGPPRGSRRRVRGVGPGRAPRRRRLRPSRRAGRRCRGSRARSRRPRSAAAGA